MNMLNIVSFNDVSERHVRFWPNKCMMFRYVKCAQRVNKNQVYISQTRQNVQLRLNE